MKDYDILSKLVCVNGPTGFEGEVQNCFEEIMSDVTDTIWKDNIGNLYAIKNGNESLPKIMINAHCDSVGFIVKYVGDQGFIYTEDLPGYVTTDYRMLPGTDVLIKSRKSGKFVEGSFVPPQPIHKLEDADLEDSEDREDLGIDIGSTSQQMTLKHVSIGDYVVIKPNLKITDIGKRIVGTSLDDRLGLYCLYRIAKNLQKCKSKSRPTIIFTSTVCEENFIGAAAVAARNTDADIALTIDSTIAVDQIVSDADYAVSKKHGSVCLDGGVALARGLGITDSVFLELENICTKDSAIKHQIEVSGAGGAENMQIQPSGRGVKTALLSIPVRNLHTRIETASIKDTENTIELATKFCKILPKSLRK